MIVLISSLFLSVVCAPHAAGQDEDTSEGSALDPGVAVRDEVAIKVVKAGPGGRARAGSWAGVLIEYRDSAMSPREIVLRITGIDRDGDPPFYQRTVVGDPERPRSAWVYAPMPYPARTDRIEISAHEAIEAEVAGGFRAGRVLGRAVLDTARLVQGESPMIGVIGTRDAGLRQYGVRVRDGIDSMPLGHAATEVVTGLSIRDLPDRWQGLAAFDVLVWSRGGPDVDPNALDSDRARALTEWVRRGGHMVILLPPVGQIWTAGGGRNPLSELLPGVVIDRREGVSLEPYRPLLTLRGKVRLPSDAVVHTLESSPSAEAGEAIGLLAGPDGAAVVSRRLVGQGMVTVIGLDIASDALSATDVLDAETIWHRVLGRRYSLDSFEQVKERDLDLSSAIQSRMVTDLDADFERLIDFRGDAGKGVLLGLGVFALYWIVAGPLGFFLLSRAGHRSRAWMAFIVTSAVFTAIAWAGATALRPNTVRATHLTFIDGVHGSGTQTASSWMSILVPSYGEAQIQIGDGSSGDLINAWTPPPPAMIGGGFPDNRGYGVSARSPSEITVPVRSTIKQLHVRWAGESVANLPRPVREPGEPGPAILELVDPDAGRVAGELVHDLPGTLEDVIIITVAGQRMLGSDRVIGPLWMPARVFMDVPADGTWAPGDRLDLGAITSGSGGIRAGLPWFADRVRAGVERTFGTEAQNNSKPEDRLVVLSLLDMLGAPDFKEDRKNGRTSPVAVVRTGHGLDLSRWFTQPCVIVIGQLVQQEGDLPIPVTVGGGTIPARGRTVVRWVYPLEARPPEYVEEAETAG